MKILLDTCVWFGVRTNLLAAGYDVDAEQRWSEDPDEEILAAAYREDRILVTLDKDFGELAIVREILLWYFAAS